MNNTLRQRTVKLVMRILRPLVEEGIVQVYEEQLLAANLKQLAARGELMPLVKPKLIDQREAAEMLGLGLSNFKKLEKENAFPFNRKMLGCSVRYRNLDIVKYIMSQDDESPLNEVGH